MSTPKNVLEYAKKNKALMVDVRFTDPFGMWQHFSVPTAELTESVFQDGFGFDGSSIRGWRTIDSSDMLVIPDPDTAFMDPFTEVPTLSLTCNIHDTITKELYNRDPRGIAKTAEAYLKSTKIADTAVFGPEAEFFIFDNVQYDSTANGTFYSVDSEEGIWNSGTDEMPNLGHKLRHKEGYFPVSPMDTFQDLRTEMVLTMLSTDNHFRNGVECQHHEVGTAGQAEIDFAFDTLVRTADNMQVYKYIIRNVGKQHGHTVTFMAKPLWNDNGSGMHTHMSLWKGTKPLFAGNKYAGLSQMAIYYIGGILKHARALTAITNPTTNSYKRLVPGFEAPVNLVYSQRNRSACVRIPTYSQSPKSKRIEFRTPDPTANPYLANAAMLMAGLDGIKNKIDPGSPMDKDLYACSARELRRVPHAPGDLGEALDCLEKDHKFLLAGDVFTEDFLDAYVEYRRGQVSALAERPHPYEFYMYYDD
jgi:glutamine synthetase